MLLHKNEIPQFSPPLGLAYIGSVLREQGDSVEILDAIILAPHGHDEGDHLRLGLDWATIRDKIASYRPDIVGISSMFTAQAQCMHRVARVAKSVDANIVTIAGGIHPSALPAETLKDENVDFVVMGEGERTVLNLVKNLSDRHPLAEIDGIGYRKGEKTVLKPKAAFIDNPDELPFPAWDLLAMKEYARLTVGHGPFVLKTPLFSVITSRGCPGKCIFCAVHSVFGHRWRARSPGNVVAEIEVLRRHYGINQIDFEDDALLLNKKRVAAICDEIVRRKLDISWATPNGVNINQLDRNLLAKMKRSGCFALSFGIESGNAAIRNGVIGKPISVKHAREVIGWCQELNIWTNGFFILGIPGESEATFRETIDFPKRLNLDSASFFIAAPFPGTELLQLCQEKSYLSKEFAPDKLRVIQGTIETESFSPESLMLWRKKAYREFGRYFLKRELLRFNMLKRVFRLRSWNDIRLFYRLGIRLFLRVFK